MARACSQDISSGCSDQIEIAALPAAVEVKEQAKVPKLEPVNLTSSSSSDLESPRKKKVKLFDVEDIMMGQ